MANKSSQKRYPDELKERAVKMVLELQREDPHDHGVFSRVARELGVGGDDHGNSPLVPTCLSQV